MALGGLKTPQAVLEGPDLGQHDYQNSLKLNNVLFLLCFLNLDVRSEK